MATSGKGGPHSLRGSNTSSAVNSLFPSFTSFRMSDITVRSSSCFMFTIRRPCVFSDSALSMKRSAWRSSSDRFVFFFFFGSPLLLPLRPS